MAKRQEKREFAVIGLGRFGSSIARRLEAFGHAVLAIDHDLEPVQAISSEVTHAARLDATNEEALREVDITAFDTVIVAIGVDFEANLLVTAALKSLGVRHVVCKATSDRQREILLRIGADRVVQPEQSAGIRLAEELSTPAMLDRIPLGANHSLAELTVPPSLVWQSISQCDLRNRYHVTVLLIRRDEQMIISPPADTVLQENDILVLLGENKHITEFGNLA